MGNYGTRIYTNSIASETNTSTQKYDLGAKRLDNNIVYTYVCNNSSTDIPAYVGCAISGEYGIKINAKTEGTIAGVTIQPISGLHYGWVASEGVVEVSGVASSAVLAGDQIVCDPNGRFLKPVTNISGSLAGVAIDANNAAALFTAHIKSI